MVSYLGIAVFAGQAYLLYFSSISTAITLVGTKGYPLVEHYCAVTHVACFKDLTA